MCRIVRFASAVTKDKLRGRGRRGGGERERQGELVRITKTAARSLLEERREGRESVPCQETALPAARREHASLAPAAWLSEGGR